MKTSGRPFRVALVAGMLSGRGGGAPRSVAQQARSLRAAGVDVELFAGYDARYPFTPDELDIREIPATVSRLVGPAVLGLFPAALRKLARRAREFDVIHLNGAWNLTTFIGASLIGRKSGTPCIISCRSHYGEYHFTRLPLLKKILFRLLETPNIRNAWALHVTSEWEEQTSWRAVRLARRVVRIPNPVNLGDFRDPPLRREARKALGLDPDAFHVVHLGRLGKQKNLPLLVEAFGRADLPPNARLHLVGPPEAAEKARLRALAGRLGIGDRLTFLDFAGGRDRCRWLAAADLFALPSFDENFCIAAIEAAACGTFSLLSPHVGAVEFLPADRFRAVPLSLDAWIRAIEETAAEPPPQNVPPPDWDAPFRQESVTRRWLEIYRQIREEK